VQPISLDSSEAGEFPSPFMISAGVKVIVEDWGICGDDLAPDLAQDVFVSMWVANQIDQEKNS
jgi:hypothetical protein